MIENTSVLASLCQDSLTSFDFYDYLSSFHNLRVYRFRKFHSAFVLLFATANLFMMLTSIIVYHLKCDNITLCSS